jgi:D-alanyl-D-alanine carboxypeptidase (penicillin-binding protein 5/6)
MALCGAGFASDQLHNPFPKVAQAYLVQIDGDVQWHKNPDQRLAPASLTKLMTALVVAELLDDNTPVAVSRAAARATGSRLGLREGETYRARDLLAATLVASANDACRALADHIAGNEHGFTQRMNQRAAQMGLTNTRFANACGHDAPGHYSSAEDLLRLAQAVMRVPQLAKWVAQSQVRIFTLDGQRSFNFKNTNALLGRYEGALGIKTGNTPKAGECLVALVRRGLHEVFLVVLNGRDRWWDAVDVLDIAFAYARAQRNPGPDPNANDGRQ